MLAIIGKIGTAGGTGYTIEFAGSAIRALSMEGRMTVCNMAIEAGARAGLIAVDETTIAYPARPALQPGRASNGRSPRRSGARSIPTPMPTGTRSSRSTPPKCGRRSPGARRRRWWSRSAIAFPTRRTSATRAGATRWSARCATWRSSRTCPITDIRIDKVFIGSCTNSRIEDLREAAAVVRRLGARVAANVKLAMVVPGSGLVKEQAEREGLDLVFKGAGFEWREPGCSMCLAMNADRLEPGERCASTSNRNFEGRQGAGGRTHLVSPAMAAAAAIEGHFVDVRRLS